jgi:Flp pilus assembly protein TadB
MDSYSRFHDVVADARARSERLQREASEQRLLQQLKRASPWRSALATQLHRLAERLEPQPEPKESAL